MAGAGAVPGSPSPSPFSPPPPSSSPRDARLFSKEDIRPEDIRELTIRNLDTGEEFVIGENDPDFEFDTFPLYAATTGDLRGQEKIPWYRSFFSWFFGKQSESRQQPQGTHRSKSMAPIDNPQFSKLSSFKFRRELGRGAFGRVLLAESKVNGQLYAIKIMSKKNMR